MTITRLRIAPEYFGFYLAGSLKVEIPQFAGQLGIISSPNCIKIPALYWNDGETTVSIGSFAEVGSLETPDFDGSLNTPGGAVYLFDANDDIASVPAATVNMRVRIWVNHPTEPDEVKIAIGD